MAVDDAGALERGGAKLEFGWSPDEAVRGYEGAAGFGPIDTVEVELGFGRAYVLLSEQRALEASRGTVMEILMSEKCCKKDKPCKGCPRFMK